MSTPKEEARRLIDGLPDSATWDDILYQFFVMTKIDAGLDAIERGDVMTQEDVEMYFMAKER